MSQQNLAIDPPVLTPSSSVSSPPLSASSSAAPAADIRGGQKKTGSAIIYQAASGTDAPAMPPGSTSSPAGIERATSTLSEPLSSFSGSQIGRSSSLASDFPPSAQPTPSVSRLASYDVPVTPPPLYLPLVGIPEASHSAFATPALVTRSMNHLVPPGTPTPILELSNLDLSQRAKAEATERTPLIPQAAPEPIHNDTEETSCSELPAYLVSWFLEKMFGFVKDTIDSFRWKNFTRPFGDVDNTNVRIWVLQMFVINLIAMIAQGLLGGLNAEYTASKYIYSAAWFSLMVLAVFSFSAMEGKRRLVGKFNQMAAEKLPDRLEDLKNFPYNITKKDVALSVTYPIKITISLVFAVLAEVSLSEKYGAAGVLLKYGWHWTDTLASILTSLPVVTVCMASAFVANIIGFPTKYALLTAWNALDHLVRTPGYKKRQAEIQCYVDALLMRILAETNTYKARYNTENPAAYAKEIAPVQELINKINKIQLDFDNAKEAVKDDDQTQIALLKSQMLEKIVALVDQYTPLPTPESWLQFIKRQTKGSSAFGIAVLGLWNFYAVAKQFLIPYFKLPDYCGPPAGVLAMTGMTALCFMAVYVPFSSNKLQLEVLTRKEKAWNHTKALVVCGLGALTNLQQAILTNSFTDPFAKYVISYGPAFLSPILIEEPGYFDYTTLPLIGKRIENNEALRSASNAVATLHSAHEIIPELSEEDLHAQYAKATKLDVVGSAPPKQYISWDFFKKEVARILPARRSVVLRDDDFVLINARRAAHQHV